MLFLKGVILVFLILATVSVARADDDGSLFGIPMGTSLDELDVAGRQKRSIYRLHRTPEFNLDFSHYMVRVHESTGVCLIIAQTDLIITGPAGEELRQEFERIMVPWSEKFGEPAIFDYIFRGSTALWAELFMTKLRSNEAVLAAKWTYNHGNVMGEQVSELLLIALPGTHGTASFVLQARLNNYRDCMYAIRRDAERKADG